MSQSNRVTGSTGSGSKIGARLAGVALAWGLAAGPAWGQDTHWIDTGTGGWFNASHWDNGVPDADTDAFINNGHTARAIDPQQSPAEARSLSIGTGTAGSAAGTLDLVDVDLDVTHLIRVGFLSSTSSPNSNAEGLLKSTAGPNHRGDVRVGHPDGSGLFVGLSNGDTGIAIGEADIAGSLTIEPRRLEIGHALDGADAHGQVFVDEGVAFVGNVSRAELGVVDGTGDATGYAQVVGGFAGAGVGSLKIGSVTPAIFQSFTTGTGQGTLRVTGNLTGFDEINVGLVEFDPLADNQSTGRGLGSLTVFGDLIGTGDGSSLQIGLNFSDGIAQGSAWVFDGQVTGFDNVVVGGNASLTPGTGGHGHLRLENSIMTAESFSMAQGSPNTNASGWLYLNGGRINHSGGAFALFDHSKTTFVIDGTTPADGNGINGRYGVIDSDATVELNGVYEFRFNFVPQNGDTFEVFHAGEFRNGFDPTDAIVVTGLNSGFQATPFIAVVNGGAGGEIFGIEVTGSPVQGTLQFLGGLTSDWFTASNWDFGSLPGVGDDAQINNGMQAIADSTVPRSGSVIAVENFSIGAHDPAALPTTPADGSLMANQMEVRVDNLLMIGVDSGRQPGTGELVAIDSTVHAESVEVGTGDDSDGTVHLTRSIVEVERTLTLGSNSTLIMDIGTNTGREGEIAQINTPAAEISGATLQINLIDGFIPDRGDVFHLMVLEADSFISGTGFAEFTGDVFLLDHLRVVDVALVPLVEGLGARVDAPGVRLIATALGDLNADGLVDVADLGVLAANFNLDQRDWFTGDINGDGTTDVADLGLLSANWSPGIGSSLSFEQALQLTGLSAAVPEPATLGVLALGLATLATRRHGSTD